MMVIMLIIATTILLYDFELVSIEIGDFWFSVLKAFAIAKTMNKTRHTLTWPKAETILKKFLGD